MERSTSELFPLETMELGNGLRVILQRDASVPLVAVHVSYLAGSRHDPLDRPGLAHLCEHLSYVRPPGEPGGNLARIVERSGGSVDARTSHDRTFFSSVVAREDLALALWAEATRMRSAGEGLDPRSLEQEQRVVVQEQRQTADRAHGPALARIHECLYAEGHPYRRMPVGTPSGVSACTRADVQGFFRAFYRPANAVLAVVGDFALEEERERILGLFAEIDGASTAASEVSLTCDPIGATAAHAMFDRVASPRVYVAFRADGFGSDDRIALALLPKCLALGEASPLHRRLVVARAAAEGVEATTVGMREATTLALCATGPRDASAAPLAEELIEAVDLALAEPIPQDAVDRARAKTRTDFYAAAQYVDRRADLLATWAAFRGDARGLERDVLRWSEVTPSDVEALAARLGRSGARSVVSVSPLSGAA